MVKTYTESGFNQKLSNMYDNEELVATSRWRNLMDPGLIGVVAQHYGFFLINGKYLKVFSCSINLSISELISGINKSRNFALLS
ncbi:hypothetical protein DFP97_101259 [Paenibacillus prosopidis]|uniref:Uncharacterized protein n=1 Tax=Paenibacillus prosopidis TaxID=630520 RepID=A0A368WDX0_9BACL|nr:hypothetical protein DFP97_101259 [Paenibacillus prosopidis]